MLVSNSVVSWRSGNPPEFVHVGTCLLRRCGDDTRRQLHSQVRDWPIPERRVAYRELLNGECPRHQGQRVLVLPLDVAVQVHPWAQANGNIGRYRFIAGVRFAIW